MGEQASPQDANRIIHAYLVVDGGGLMASDESAATEYKGMFFSEGYGQFVDKFGTPWMVNTASA